ncbi:MAG: YceD family protein [Undibacterium sp.]|nr:YceD family protein [Undibacterium sp.]
MQAFVIDAFSFCQHGEVRTGSTKIADFSRLSLECVSGGDLVHWTVQGEIDAQGLPKLGISVQVQAPLICQRCLSALEFQIDSQSELILAKNDAHADEVEAMLDDDEVDVVVGSRTFNVMEVIEDEALLAIPQSPKHAVCPDGTLVSSEISETVAHEDVQVTVGASGKVSPFAVLKKLN